MYGYGQGVEQNDVLAHQWIEKAAQQGFVQAQYNLGVMYYYGHGVAQNDVRSKYWFEKAAQQGFSHEAAALRK